MTNGDRHPLILTLMLDTTAQLYFDRLRKLHFPTERNYLNAHLTLFHHLPQQEPSILEDLYHLSVKTASLTLAVDSIVSIGNGTAFKIKSDELILIHRQLQNKWKQWLIPQDQQKLWPHITVQNKVDAQMAKQLQLQLTETFQPFNIRGIGFSLWEYKGGPWNFLQGFSFNSGLF